MLRARYVLVAVLSTLCTIAVWRFFLGTDSTLTLNQMQSYRPPPMKGNGRSGPQDEQFIETGGGEVDHPNNGARDSFRGRNDETVVEVLSTIRKSDISSSSSSSSSSTDSSTSSGSAPTVEDIDITDAVHPLTSEQLSEFVAAMSITVANMSFTFDKTFPAGFKLDFLPEYKNPCWKEKGTLWCLPYFFIGGFPKCGTTELFAKLTTHPDIRKGKSKEPHWWTRTRYTRPKLFEFYTEFFSQADKDVEKIVDADGFHPVIVTEGSASTVWDNSHLFSLESYQEPSHLNIHAIRAVLPDAKFVLIIRNPVSRLYSDYLFFQSQYSPENFHYQVSKSIEIFSECLQDGQKSFLYCMYAPRPPSAPKLFTRFRIALYYVHLKIVLSVIPRSNVFVVRLEDYMVDQVKWLRDIMTFLDVPVMSANDIETIINKQKAANTNKKGYVKAGPMLNKTQTLLEEFYRPFNSGLASLLGGGIGY